MCQQLIDTIQNKILSANCNKCEYEQVIRPTGQTSECQFCSRMHQNLHYRTSVLTVCTFARNKQVILRPQTSPLVCNSLHHKVTGLWLAASATAHGLAAWLHR